MEPVNRRRFLYCTGVCLLGALPGSALLAAGDPKPDTAQKADIRGRVFKGDAPGSLWKWSRESYLYQKSGDGTVICGICPNRCVLAPGDRSACRSKVNLNGVLYTLAYGNPCSVNVDPVEKKPLYHFLPQSRAFSLATTGCNLRCLNCQNWEISQVKPHEVRHYELFPAQAVAEAIRSGCSSIAYTYSEPTTFFEYMIDIARPAREAGIKNLWISNGYIQQKPLLDLCKVLDGANVNLKSFSDDIYRKLNGGRLAPVLNTFKTLHDQGVHFEMTTLVVPGYVDDPDMIKRMCEWIVTELGPDHPLHFSRFFPRYKLDRLPPTPESTLTTFREIAMRSGIRYVYLGNLPGHEGNNTSCHHCKKVIIRRMGYAMDAYHIQKGKCEFCGTVIPGVWPEKT